MRASGALVRVLTPIVAPFVIAWELLRVGVPALWHAVVGTGRGIAARLRAAVRMGIVAIRAQGRVLGHLQARASVVVRGLAGAVADVLRAAGRAVAHALRVTAAAMRAGLARSWVALRGIAVAMAAAVRRVATAARRFAVAAWTLLMTPIARLAASITGLLRAVGRAVVMAAAWSIARATALGRGVADAIRRGWRNVALAVGRVGRRVLGVFTVVASFVLGAIDAVVHVVTPVVARAWALVVVAIATGVRGVAAIARHLVLRLRAAALLARWSIRIAWRSARRAAVSLAHLVAAAVITATRAARRGAVRVVRLVAPVIVIPAILVIVVGRRAVVAGRAAWVRIAAAARRSRAAIGAAGAAAARSMRRIRTAVGAVAATTARTVRSRSALVRASVATTVRDVRARLRRIRASVAASVAAALGRPPMEAPVTPAPASVPSSPAPAGSLAPAESPAPAAGSAPSVSALPSEPDVAPPIRSLVVFQPAPTPPMPARVGPPDRPLPVDPPPVAQREPVAAASARRGALGSGDGSTGPRPRASERPRRRP